MSLGLNRKDQNLLNGLSATPPEERRKIFAAKRQEYANDPEALQQIDAFDSETEYYKKLFEFRDALITHNWPLAADLEEWFQARYPSTLGK